MSHILFTLQIINMNRIALIRYYRHYYPTNILNRSIVTNNINNNNKDENIEETNQAIISSTFVTHICPNMNNKIPGTESHDDNHHNNDDDYEYDYDF
ncbi:hypothetical protein QKC54_gp0125 [Megavirus baoshan]|uniref:Uncharacterized protein n=1 Tax=Megavirus baoshan TaxID=2496520 RepID=A0A8K1T1A5_9VIRU|nr:hypothetical protein QKC54_gp0125 [Megavirus baoshan]UFX99899.1 hypothetical protein Mb0947 [Megavirus baoshan]